MSIFWLNLFRPALFLEIVGASGHDFSAATGNRRHNLPLLRIRLEVASLRRLFSRFREEQDCQRI
jgi:hypothetical protein